MPSFSTFFTDDGSGSGAVAGSVANNANGGSASVTFAADGTDHDIRSGGTFTQNNVQACNYYDGSSAAVPSIRVSLTKDAFAADASDYSGPVIWSSAGNCYAVIYDATSYKIAKFVSGTPTTLATGSATPTTGDIMRLTLTGGTLALDINGSSDIAPFADATYGSGVGSFRMVATARFTPCHNLLVETVAAAAAASSSTLSLLGVG